MSSDCSISGKPLVWETIQWHQGKSRSIVVAIGLGQILSVLICGTAVTSTLLYESKVSIPTAQSFFNYVLLALIFCIWLSVSQGPSNLLLTTRQRGYIYAIFAFVEVEATYLMVKAYQYTSMTSVQLLDCFAIPTILILSRQFLHIRYRWLHYAGVLICMLGAVALFLADYLVEQHSNESTNQILGNMLCIGGAVLYGISNVFQEYMVGRHGSVEYLAFIGFFASLISGVQLAILERKELTSLDFSSIHITLLMLGFITCLFLVYTLMPYIISHTGAMSVNLNLLSSDLYSFLFGKFLFNYSFHALHLVSFALITIGVIVYNVRPPRDSDTTTLELTAVAAAPPALELESRPDNSKSEDTNSLNPNCHPDSSKCHIGCLHIGCSQDSCKLETGHSENGHHHQDSCNSVSSKL